MNQSEYKDSDFCILTFFRAGEVRRISCYSRYTRKPQWTRGNGTFTYNVPVTYCYIQTPPNFSCFVFYLKKKKNTWFIISNDSVGWPGGSSATLTCIILVAAFCLRVSWKAQDGKWCWLSAGSLQVFTWLLFFSRLDWIPYLSLSGMSFNREKEEVIGPLGV